MRDTVSARFFCGIQSFVSSFHGLFKSACGIISDSKTYGHGNALSFPLDVELRYSRSKRFSKLSRRAPRNVVEYQNEFFTSYSSNRVIFANIILQMRSHLPDHLIARGMSVGIVDLFKKVDVDHDDLGAFRISRDITSGRTFVRLVHDHFEPSTV